MNAKSIQGRAACLLGYFVMVAYVLVEGFVPKLFCHVGTRGTNPGFCGFGPEGLDTHIGISRRRCSLPRMVPSSSSLQVLRPAAGALRQSKVRNLSLEAVKHGPADENLLRVEITPDLIRKTAGLAQIQITDEEVDDLLPRMEQFIGFVETMEEVDEADDGDFGTLACGSYFLREDSIKNFANVAAVMDNMPVEEGNYLRVPKVGEDEG